MTCRIFIISLFCLPFNLLFAQKFSISAVVVDSIKTPLTGAAAQLISLPDSAIVATQATNSEGSFDFDGLNAGRKAVKISYLGFQNLYVETEVIDKNLFLGKLIMRNNATQLATAVVEEKLISSLQKGDTSQYNAGAFKSNVDATAEDLLTKMPGMKIEGGKMQAQGENVAQVLVDGKPFFGDDPNAVLKNIPAEIIDKIQVFDKKSDQASFTGIDDGNTTKTINIITKSQFRNGRFGKMYAGYGDQQKYKAGLNYNHFKRNQRFSILAQSNNINEQNFSSDDLLGVLSSASGGIRNGAAARGGAGRSGRGGNSNDANDFLVDQKSGITSTDAIGVNYSNKWNKFLDLNASYFLNQTNNKVFSEVYRQYLFADAASLKYSQHSTYSGVNLNQRAALKLEWKVDSMTSFLFQPRFSFQKNESSSYVDGRNTANDELLNNTENKNSNVSTGQSFSAPLLFRHRFTKPGRTLSVNVSPAFAPSNAKNNLNSLTVYAGTVYQLDSIFQEAKSKRLSRSIATSASFTEALNKYNFLEFSSNLSYSENKSEKFTSEMDEQLLVVSTIDTALSNSIANNYDVQNVGLAYKFQKEMLTTNVGISYQQTQLNTTQIYPSAFILKKTFVSLLPNASLRFAVSAKKILRINYRTSNNAPAVSQLQQVLNNSNPTQLYIGNTSLKQDFTHNFNVRYSSANTKKSSNFFALLGGNYTSNYIGNKTLITTSDTIVGSTRLLSGAQLFTYANMKKSYSIRSLITFGFPLSSLKSNFNINVAANYASVPGLINEKLNNATTPSASVGLTLSSNINERIDFTISSTSTYNRIINSISNELNSENWNQNSRVKANWVFWKSVAVQSEIINQRYAGLSNSFNVNFYLWNGGLSCKFARKKECDLRIFVFDILKQNRSVQRTSYDTYIEDTRSNVLTRYVMFILTYTFKQNFAAKETK